MDLDKLEKANKLYAKITFEEAQLREASNAIPQIEHNFKSDDDKVEIRVNITKNGNCNFIRIPKIDIIEILGIIELRREREVKKLKAELEAL